jgi:hypothetical protein
MQNNSRLQRALFVIFLAAAATCAADLFAANNKVLVQAIDGTPKQICFADHATDFAPAAANDLRVTTDGSQETDAQLLLENVASVTGTATNTGARQSAKVDLGTDRARCYAVKAAFELAATPTAGNVIELWWAPSSSSTAANRNPGAVSGSDAAYTGYSNNCDVSLVQLVYIGDFVCTAQATGTVQVAEVGLLFPRERWGSLVVRNKSGAAFHSDSVECNVVFDPIVEEVQ